MEYKYYSNLEGNTEMQEEKSDAKEEGAKTYFINHDKSRDACSIIWRSDEHVIGDLEPYIYAIQCDDGEDFHDLINADWPDADGMDTNLPQCKKIMIG
jgi:hypothetical protein